MQELFRNPSHSKAVHNRQEDGIAQILTKPHTHGHTGTSRCRTSAIASVLDEIQGQEQEGVPQAIVRPGLGSDDVLEIPWDVEIRELSLDDHVGQDWVGGSYTRRYDKRVQEGQVGDQGPHEEARGEPHGCHNRAQQDSEGSPFRSEIPTG